MYKKAITLLLCAAIIIVSATPVLSGENENREYGENEGNTKNYRMLKEKLDSMPRLKLTQKSNFGVNKYEWVYKNGTVFENVTLGENENENNLDENENKNEINDEINSLIKDKSEAPKSKSTYIKARVFMPTVYDMRKENLITETEDQGDDGTCWAYSTSSAISSVILKNGLENYIPISDEELLNLTDKEKLKLADISESHMVWFTKKTITDNRSDGTFGDGIYHEDPWNDGATDLETANSLTRWCGPKFEDESEQLDESDSEWDVYPESMRYISECLVQEIREIYKPTKNDIKEELFLRGSGTITYISDSDGYYDALNGDKTYYLPYESDNWDAFHRVVLIGWDDNYPVENFKVRPKRPGAWLAKNSWGKDWGDEGCFWISYEEKSLQDFLCYGVVPRETFDKNYQYDGNGYNYFYEEGKGLPVIGANVFKADGYEILKAVSFHTTQPNTYYNVKIYVNPDLKNEVPIGKILECETSGFIKHKGYYTIPIEEVYLEKGDYFSVVLTQICETDTASLCGEDENTIHSSKENQSFLYYNKEWVDLNKIGYNNICIKAFTKVDDYNTLHAKYRELEFEADRFVKNLLEFCDTEEEKNQCINIRNSVYEMTGNYMITYSETENYRNYLRGLNDIIEPKYYKINYEPNVLYGLVECPKNETVEFGEFFSPKPPIKKENGIGFLGWSAHDTYNPHNINYEMYITQNYTLYPVMFYLTDLNNDEESNIVDVIILLQYVSGIGDYAGISEEYMAEYVDFNGDGCVNIIDVILYLKNI